MPDEMIQLPIETGAMDEIFQTLSQIGEIVENMQTKENSFHYLPQLWTKDLRSK